MKNKPTKSAPKKAPAKRPQAQGQSESQKAASPEEKARQQAILDVFNTAFRDVLYSADFSTQLQEVKTALYKRDFEAAFAREEALAVYAARWSPTRALGYGHILRGLDGFVRELVDASESAPGEGEGEGEKVNEREPAADVVTQGDQTSGQDVKGEESQDAQAEDKATSQKALKVLAIGGAAAELVAVVDYLSTLSPIPKPEITLLDIGPWTSVINTLTTTLTTPAKSSFKTQTQPLLLPASSLQPRILQADILSTDVKTLLSEAGGPVLITLLFTLNELYTTSGIKATTSFLRNLGTCVTPGTLLLVVDSPGSYAETSVGKEGRRYPMQWLLDHTLVPPPSNERGAKEEVKPKWERLETHDSIWFRVAEGLRYPIPLENMRYQLHLYRALE